MSWATEVSKPSQIVLLDGKNATTDVCAQLKRLGIATHVFVADDEGKFEDSPLFKGNDFSAKYREGEIDAIARLHAQEGVAAVVAIQSMYNRDTELLSAIQKLREKIPGVKVIVLGASPTGLFFAPADDAQARHDIAHVKKQVTAGDAELPLVSGIDAASFSYADPQRNAALLESILPGLRRGGRE